MFDRVARIYKAVAILVLNAFLVVCAAELIARGVLSTSSLMTAKEQPVDARQRSSYYRDKSWARQYWQEYARSERQQYHAFTVWRRAAFHGQTINIDSQGVRMTPGSECTQGAFRVFTFGSSSMWGTGSPDWGTIPAYLAVGLRSHRIGPVCVMNFGESGYVTTQSVIELMLQLQAGNIPNAAVFYDGVSDIYAGFQSGRARDVHENFEQIASRIERRNVPTSPLIIQFLESMSLFKVIDNQVGKLSGAEAAPQATTYETMNVDRISLANSIVDTYFSNYSNVDVLSRRYGFDYYFFWPPHISKGTKLLTSEEKTEKAAVDPAFQRLFDAVYDRISERAGSECKNLFLLNDAFDPYTSSIWLDDTHVTPVGNEMVAKRMLTAMNGHEAGCEEESGKIDRK